MKAENFWQMFIDTGAPEAYMLYHYLKRTEGLDVSEGSGDGFTGNPLQ